MQQFIHLIKATINNQKEAEPKVSVVISSINLQSGNIGSIPSTLVMLSEMAYYYQF